jgi:L-rhamnose-H+ transport protein
VSPVLGFLLAVLAGGLNGSFALPMKRTTRWAWENTWLVYSIVGMVVVNWAIASRTVPGLATVYERAGPAVLAMVLVFGSVWGIANLLFGLGIDWIGISLTFPICIGLSTALGSLIPMARRPEVFGTRAGMATTLGVAVILAGVFVCAVAGVQKDAQQARAAAGNPNAGTAAGRRFARGLAVVVLAGLFDPMLNYAFVFGDRIKEEAVSLGASGGAEADAIWTLALLGSFLVNATYCGLLLWRNATWPRYLQKAAFSHWWLAGLMGLIWMLSITLYGRGAAMMGKLGGSIGWAVFYVSIILSSSLWGILAGEWRGGQGRPLRTMAVGLGVLLAAVIILGYANALGAE